MRESIQFDVAEKTITVRERMHMNVLYSEQQNLFDEPGYMQYMVPMSAQTPTQYSLINGWNFADEESKKNMMGCSWEVRAEGSTWQDLPVEEWVNITTLGTLNPSDLQLQYRFKMSDGEWTDWIDFKYTGMVDEAIRRPLVSRRDKARLEVKVKPPFEDRGSSYETDFGYPNIVVPIFFDGLWNQDIVDRLREVGEEEVDKLLALI